MAFGIYVHIPFCIQKCGYCDFATLPQDQGSTYKTYVASLVEELQLRRSSIPYDRVDSLYFGGGTPSLIDAEDILYLRRSLANAGFHFSSEAEITIEINPGTIDQDKLDLYRAAGINRYSVGVQTFVDSILKRLGREHSAEDSSQTLRLLKDNNCHFTADIMFGLPQQTLVSLESDINEILKYNPEHLSFYNLTIPPGHSLNRGRAPDAEQANMFLEIDALLLPSGIFRYEISNFAKNGLESKHNQLYWTNGAYWGLGIGAHSYLPEVGPYGTRFWNPRVVNKYNQQIKNLHQHTPSFWDHLPPSQRETLKLHESLTDFFHTRLRQLCGFSRQDFFAAYDEAHKIWPFVEQKLNSLLRDQLIEFRDGFYHLSPTGLSLANRVFLNMTFLAEDLL